MVRFSGLEIKPYSQLTELPKVRIDRVRVEVQRTLFGEVEYHLVGTMGDEGKAWPICAPLTELPDVWERKKEEELGEATSAASEVLMLLSYHEQGCKKRDLTARLEHLAGELADVVNVTEQVIQLFGLETDFKVARHAGIQKTLKRIREEEQANEVRNEPARLDF